MNSLALRMPLLAFAVRQLGWVGWLGAAAALAGLGGLLIAAPALQRSNADSAGQVEALRRELAQMQDPKVADAARDPLVVLVGSLPPVTDVPDFVAAIQRRAEEGGVQIDRTEYRVQPVLGHAAQRYRLSFPANADYPHLRTWLEALLHDYPNLILDELSLHRAADGGEELEARVGVSFLVRDSK